MRKFIVASGVLALLAIAAFGFYYTYSGGRDCPTSPTPFGTDASECPGGKAPAGSIGHIDQPTAHAPAYGTSHPVETDASGRLNYGDPGPSPNMVPSPKCPDPNALCGSTTAGPEQPPQDNPCCETGPTPGYALRTTPPSTHHWQLGGWPAVFGVLLIGPVILAFGTGKWRRYEEEEQESQKETVPWPFV